MEGVGKCVRVWNKGQSMLNSKFKTIFVTMHLDINLIVFYLKA